MEILSKISKILNFEELNEKLKEENQEIEKIVKDLDRRAIIKLEKVKSSYSYAERALKDGRYSEYKNISSYKEFNVSKFVNVIKTYGYKPVGPGTKLSGNFEYETFVKSSDDMILVYYKKYTTEVDSIVFNYKEDKKWKY